MTMRLVARGSAGNMPTNTTTTLPSKPGLLMLFTNELWAAAEYASINQYLA
jgi:hypothetical protein